MFGARESMVQDLNEQKWPAMIVQYKNGML
jgi:hypothetical protein